MKWLKKLWNKIDGIKTSVGGFLLGVGEIMPSYHINVKGFEVDVKDAVNLAGGILLGTGLTHKAVKKLPSGIKNAKVNK